MTELIWQSEGYPVGEEDVVVGEEAAIEDCLYCQFGAIPDDALLPFPLCVKHLDVAAFVLEKAHIPVKAEWAGDDG